MVPPQLPIQVALLCKFFFSGSTFYLIIIKKNLINVYLNIREEKEDANHSVESTPQATPIPPNASAPSQTPNSEQQPEVDEDGYCIQPRDPLWNSQWNKKGLQSFFK